jgi:hypothetical protein
LLKKLRTIVGKDKQKTMQKITDRVNEKLASPVWALILTITACLAIIFAAVFPDRTLLIWILGFLAVGILGLLNLYSLFVRNHNLAFKKSWRYIGEINGLYKKSFDKIFIRTPDEKANEISTKMQADIASIQRDTVSAVLVRIAELFSVVIDRQCVATIKLITAGEKQNYFAESYARSVPMNFRDDSGVTLFEISAKSNIGFYTALTQYSDFGVSYFYSPNLLVDPPNYTNGRENFERFYRSTIIVAIAPPKGTRSATFPFDALGFLCIDTASTHRLNDAYHLDLLGGFADQMYNYLCVLGDVYSWAKPNLNDRDNNR